MPRVLTWPRRHLSASLSIAATLIGLAGTRDNLVGWSRAASSVTEAVADHPVDGSLIGLALILLVAANAQWVARSLWPGPEAAPEPRWPDDDALRLTLEGWIPLLGLTVGHGQLAANEAFHLEVREVLDAKTNPNPRAWDIVKMRGVQALAFGIKVNLNPEARTTIAALPIASIAVLLADLKIELARAGIGYRIVSSGELTKNTYELQAVEAQSATGFDDGLTLSEFADRLEAMTVAIILIRQTVSKHTALAQGNITPDPDEGSAPPIAIG